MTRKTALYALIAIIIAALLLVLAPVFLPQDSSDPVEAGEIPAAAQASDDLTLTAEQVSAAGIEWQRLEEQVQPLSIKRPGEVVPASDKVAEIAPGISGTLRRVHAKEGDSVTSGTALAALESTDLAAAQADYDNARDRLRLAEVSYEREARLWKQQITSEVSYLDAKRALQEARIELRTAGQSLKALGLDPEKSAADDPGRYILRSPLDGIVTRRRGRLGQVVAADTPLFTVADLSSVWINVRLYPDDIGRVTPGSRAQVFAGEDAAALEGKVLQAVPQIDETTRQAPVIVEVDNRRQTLSPGAFVSVSLETSDSVEAFKVPETALVKNPDGTWQIFSRGDENTFAPVAVEVIQRVFDGVLIDAPVSGKEIVTQGAFFLRAELDKGSLADDDD